MNLAGISFALIICSNLRSSQQGNLRAVCYSLTISRRRVWARRQLLRGANKGSLCVACKPEGHFRGEVQMDELDRRQLRHPQTPAGERTELTFGQVQPRDLTQQRIRPGSFRAPQELVTAIKVHRESQPAATNIRLERSDGAHPKQDRQDSYGAGFCSGLFRGFLPQPPYFSGGQPKSFTFGLPADKSFLGTRKLLTEPQGRQKESLISPGLKTPRLYG